KDFYKYAPQIESFAQVIEDKAKDPINRQVLVEVLQEQYAVLAPSEAVNKNVSALADEKTYTVTTAHQPSLFTGPLYYIYKIISTINLAKQLKEAYPAFHFVPVFVTGGEDHDFEEIQNVHLFNKTLTWENEEKGSVGMMKTDTLGTVLSQLKEILGEQALAVEIYRIVEAAHTQNTIYSQASIQLVHQLFKGDGLVVVNMNHSALKGQFVETIKKELELQPSLALIHEAHDAISGIGFKPQATARAINFFYLKDQIRERIVEENGLYQVLNTDFQFTRAQILEEVEQHPERFSPNVVMRPIYQETILPNLAYIGGGGELAYWMERRAQFDYFGVNYPMLIRRNSVLWIDKGMAKKMKKFAFGLPDWFGETESLIKQFVAHQSESTLSLDQQKTAFTHLYEEIKEIAKQVNPTLEKTVMAEHAKQLKSLEHLETKLIRAEKQKHEVGLNQLRNVKEKLFPANGLQERKDNFIPFFLKYGWEFFEILKLHLHPLDKNFIVIEDV
ncbi:MAG: bacillithiol biosynthesis cysteine-adding enzyme BshC, partial [Bacteroidota bacterium]